MSSGFEFDTGFFWQADAAPVCKIPVSRPQLPVAEQILPYLHRIDTTRIYSNGGALTNELKYRFAAHFNAKAVAICANATCGLALALMANEPTPGSLCMVPAWTFVASAHAIRMAGLVPWLVDVDPETQQLTCSMARALLANAPGPVAAIMPVAPFGAPLATADWDAFAAETGLAVVIDAAAAFDSVRLGNTPCVISLHATKLIGIGEGAVIVCNDESLIRKIEYRGNFGFVDSRESRMSAINAKLSEYGAAIGLAALDRWPQSRPLYQFVASMYRYYTGDIDVALQDGIGENWVSSTVVARLGRGMRLDRVIESMTQAGIGVRCWWAGGLHSHSAFSKCPRTELCVTDELARISLGLPCSPDLSAAQIEEICAILASRQ